MRILVLDDKMLLVKDVIRDIGKVDPEAECFGFSKESEALDFAARERLDVALLDIDMPNMSGITVAEQLCQMQPFINIIFLTGYLEYALDSYKVFASDFLVKPVSRTELKKAFEHLRYPVSSSKNKYDIVLLGKRLREKRYASGMTVETLAEKLGVSFQTIYRWETGERIPDTTKLIAIANVFGISLDELLSE